MAAQKTAVKAIKATKGTRRVAEENVPAELRNLYNRSNPEEVSLDFDETGEDEAPVPMDVLFRSKGVDYMIPQEFGPGVGLIYLDRIGEGRDVALGEILKTVIGAKGWAALMELARENRVTGPQLKAIMSKVETRTMGAVEGMEGN